MESVRQHFQRCLDAVCNSHRLSGFVFRQGREHLRGMEGEKNGKKAKIMFNVMIFKLCLLKKMVSQ